MCNIKNTDIQTHGAWIVYLHTNLINNKKYIGITSQTPQKRWRNGLGYKDGVFRLAIDKYGWENFSHEILFSGLSETEAKNKEIELISLYNTTDRNYGYNRTKGGDGAAGIEVSEDTREKMSKSHLGKRHSDATKEKISNAAKGNKKWSGKKHTYETKNKMSNVRKEYYKKHPVSFEEKVLRSERAKEAYVNNPELSKNISQKRKQYFIDNPNARRELSLLKIEYYKNNPEARKRISKQHKKPVDMFCVDGTFIKTFDSLTNAKLETGIDRSSIARVCNGKQRTAGGYLWKYYIN